MTGRFNWFRIKNRTRAAFNEAVDRPADDLSGRQLLAKLFKTALNVVQDNGMYGIWRTVTESRKARENEAAGMRIHNIDDLDGKYMRPLLFHFDRSVIPRLFEKPDGSRQSFIALHDRIKKAVVYDLRVPEGDADKAEIRVELAKEFDGSDENDPGYYEYSSHEDASDGLTGFQSLKGFVQICQIMLTQARALKLTGDEQEILREAVRAYKYCIPAGIEPSLPPEAQRDMDDLHTALAMGELKFSRDGQPRLPPVKYDDPEFEEEPDDETRPEYDYP